MQINRLFEIVYILLQKRKVTAKELADKFEVSTRTIYRDIEILSSANIPIYATKGKAGGICLLDNYVLNKSILSEEEQNQILFALQTLERMKGKNEDNILEKMSTIFDKKVDDWIKVDFSGWGKESDKEVKFENIKSAILNKQIIKFTYYNSNGEESKRIIEPLQICFKDKAWYLVGYCKTKKDYRIFKIVRMKEIEILEEHFERRLPNQKEDKRNYIYNNIKLELEIDKTQAYRVYEEFEDEQITKKSDGSFIIKVEYPENDWVYGIILSFENHIKVLAPEKVKNRIKEILEETLKKYL